MGRVRLMTLQNLSKYTRSEIYPGLELYTETENYNLRLRPKELSLIGSGYRIVLGDGADVRFDHLRLRGGDGVFMVGQGAVLRGVQATLKGRGSGIYFGDGCKTGGVRLVAAEGCRITVGEGSLFSHGITIRTSDMHPITDRATGERINPAEDVTVGSDVWLAQDAHLQKGVTIGEGCVIGTASLVTRDVPPHCLAAGVPARVLRENITWERQLLNEDDSDDNGE